MDFESFCRLFGDYMPKVKKDGERYYSVNDEVAAFKSGEQRKPYATGLFLGRGSKNFAPSPALLTLLAASSGKKAVLVNDRSEWFFLCGRDVFADGFRAQSKEGFVLVQNERDENLGLGKIVTNTDGAPLLKNVLDRGNYLRHQTVNLEGPHLRKKKKHT